MKNKLWMKTTSLAVVCAFTLAVARPAHAGWKELGSGLAEIIKAASPGATEVAVTYIKEEKKAEVIQGCLSQVLGSKESLILTACGGAAILIGAFACYKAVDKFKEVKVGKYGVKVTFKDGSKTVVKEETIEVLDPNVITAKDLTNNSTAPVCPR